MEDKVKEREKQILQLEEKAKIQDSLITEYDSNYRELKDRMHEDLKNFEKIKFDIK